MDFNFDNFYNADKEHYQKIAKGIAKDTYGLEDFIKELRADLFGVFDTTAFKNSKYQKVSEGLSKDEHNKRSKQAFDNIYTILYLTALYKTPQEIQKESKMDLKEINEIMDAFKKEIVLLTFILEFKKEKQKITYGISNETNRVLINAYLQDFHAEKYPKI